MRKAFLMGIAGLVLSVQTARAANVPTEQQWLSKLKHSAQTSGANDQHHGEMLFAVGNFYHKQKQFDREQPMYDAAMCVFEKSSGKNGDLLRYYSDALGHVYLDEGKLDKAETMFKRALQIGDSIPGKDKTYVVPNTLAGLADVYAAQARYPEAEAALKRRIEMRHRFMNAGQVDVAFVDLANLYTKWGKLDQAKTVIDLLLTMQTPPGQVKGAVASYTAAVSKQ